METLESQTALVTGASSGIGAAIARHLLSLDYSVTGIARDFSKLEELSPDFHKESIDLSRLEELPKRLKPLTCPHVLVCNAGQALFGHLEEYSYQQIQSLMDLNFMSHVFCIRHFLPQMKKRKQGDIILIGSEAALAGKKKGSLYCASKWALRGFSQALREECRSVRITLINPGPVSTPFFEGQSFAPKEGSDHAIDPQDIAELVAHIVQSRPGTCFDEINLSPLKPALHFF